MGRGWRGARFPVLTKFIDASGPLPVHLHADDADAHRLEGAPHGKTEAWHILDAPPGATALAGVHPGVDAATLRDALVRGDFDAVMRRLPVRPGETLYVPAGATIRLPLPTAKVLTNVGAPVHVGAGGPPERLEPARTLLLPAALHETRIDGPADVLIGYLTDLETDVRTPLAAAGYGPQLIAGLDG
ncbi:class I mannose-6-phosphate isomerase [Actinomadura nitritigenes]|uniref:class I mannose-6-phosphate isomerase n=1 Tax=Actinomadura nitritigenes TaxID=134602 RepID=UPI003D90AD16